MLCVQEKGQNPKRNEVERIARLRDVRVAVDRRLKQQRDRDRHRQERERELGADPRTLDCPDRSENCAR